MRFGIWAAVSTVAQANDDKESLTEQEKKCRSLALAKGWTETVRPFIVPGESRTRWVNLRDAENEIPPLRQMLESAKAGKFDILVLYDYNRLRDLLDPVAKTLASYGVQIYSINQPVEPIQPEEFNPYASDSESMMRGMSQIISRWQISDLRRKYRFGVPARVQRGLYALKIPYGYRKPAGREWDKSAIPVPDEIQSEVVILIKDLFLNGTPYRKIQDHLNKTGCPTATGVPWARTTIIKILQNPFYAGKVYFGRRRVIRDPRLDTLRVVKNPTPLIMDGKHSPLYSWDEYLRIQIEFERRGRFPYGNVYTFSGLLSCSVCGGKIKHKRDYWHCVNYHVKIKDKNALEIIPPAIQEALQKAEITPTAIQKSDQAPLLEELQRKRAKVQQAFEREVYSLEEAQTRIKEIESQIAEIRDSKSHHEKQELSRSVFYSEVKAIRDMPQFIEFIVDEDPAIINPLLLRVIKTIEISPDYSVKVHLIED